MKYPVFYKDPTGEYHRTPPDFEIFEDGEVGFTAGKVFSSPATLAIFVAHVKGRIHYQPGLDRYIILPSIYEQSNP